MDISIDFDFDEDGFERAIKDAAESGVRDLVDQYNRDYAEMTQRLEGRPLDEIKEELVAYYRNRDGEISDPELTEHAEHIQAGREITFRYGGMNG